MGSDMYKVANRRLAANKIRLEVAGIPIEVVSIRFIEYTDLPLVPYYLSHKHKHSYYEVGVWLQGKQNYLIDEKNVEVKSGDVFFTAPNVYHAIPNCDLYIEKYTICFSIGSAKDGKEVKWVSSLRELPYYIGTDNQELRSLFELILSEAYNAGEGWQAAVKSLIAVLILKLARLANPHDATSEELEGMSELDQRMLNADRFIRDNLATVTCIDVASVLHLSLRQLNRDATKKFGMTMKKYIDFLRYEQARKLILESRLTISQVGMEVGFKDRSDFHRFFKRMDGSSPGEYFNRTQKKEDDWNDH